MTDIAETKKPLGTFGVALRLGGGFFLAIFGAGIAAGVFAAWREHGEFRTGVVIGLALAALALVAGGWLIFSARGNLALPRSPQVRRSRIALYASLGISTIIGVAAGFAWQMQVSHDDPAHGLANMFAATPLSLPLTLAVLVAWIVTVALSLYWHTTLDEIERAEYEFGAMAGLYSFVTVAPAWWLAWRGGLLPEPNGVAICLMVCIVWCIGWGWRRWR